MEFWLTALFFSTLHNFDLNSFCRGFFFEFVFGQTVNQMTDTYRLSIHRPGGQGGDTRREEVLPKGIVDISIHITSHASVTAQN